MGVPDPWTAMQLAAPYVRGLTPARVIELAQQGQFLMVQPRLRAIVDVIPLDSVLYLCLDAASRASLVAAFAAYTVDVTTFMNTLPHLYPPNPPLWAQEEIGDADGFRAYILQVGDDGDEQHVGGEIDPVAGGMDL